jgi:SAM-dependent methyltransferase
MDFDPATVEYVRTALGIPAVCTDAERLGNAFEPESFDVISAFHVVEHVTDVETTLVATRKLLKPGGWLVIAGPLIDSVQARILGRRWTAVTEAPRHITIPTRTGLARICERAGFDPNSFRIVPDAAVSCAAVFALSLFPGGASTAAYGSARWLALVSRQFAAVGTLVATPLAWFENRVLNQPALALFFAQSPRTI